MADKVIGIDVGTNAVRAAEVVLGATPRLVRFGQVALPAGAVDEGEVVDVDAVAEALKRLWREAGFSSRRVRVGIASARVIVRIVELPLLSDADTTSTLGLQLPEYVPLPPESTVFDFQPLETVDAEEGPQRRLLLAAAHEEAVRPLVEAVAKAGLKLAAVDVIPAALARALVPGPPPTSLSTSPPPWAARPSAEGSEPLTALGALPHLPHAAGDVGAGADGDIEDGDGAEDSAEDGGPAGDPQGPVEAIVSIGAGTTVVVVARAATPLFSRTITSVAGRQVTERIATELSVTTEEAERRKRGIPSDDPETEEAEGEALAGAALHLRLAEGPLVSELVAEVVDSLAFYDGQPGALTVERVLLTGGGSLLDGLPELLAERLGLDVAPADPLLRAEVGDLGFEPEDLPFLAPYLGAALGVALGGDKTRTKRIDLRPASGQSGRSRRPLLAGGVAALLLVATAGFYVQRSGAIGQEEVQATVLRAQLAELQVPAADGASAGAVRTPSSLQAILDEARDRDADWLAVVQQLDGISAPLGVQISSLQGATTAPVTGKAKAGATASDAAGEVTTTTSGAAPPDPATTALGQITLTAAAPGLEAVAGWVDAMEADLRFDDAWVSGVTSAGEGGGGVQFAAQVTITGANLVPRPLIEVAR